MNLFHLRYFVKLAHEQHYTRAAEKLCITQPSLSNAMAQLEKELGIRLFEKNGRRVSLTVYGQQFFECALAALATLDSGVESLVWRRRGRLIRLGILRTLGITFIPELIASYQKANPERKITFTIDSDVSQKLIDGLDERRFDVIFATAPGFRRYFRMYSGKNPPGPGTDRAGG